MSSATHAECVAVLPEYGFARRSAADRRPDEFAVAAAVY